MDTRSKLDQALGYPIPDADWAMLVHFGVIADYEIGERPMQDIVREAKEVGRKLRGAIATGTEKRMETSRPVEADPAMGRELAVSHVLMLQARGEHGVIQFRREHLADSLLKPEEVGNWLSSRAASDGEPSLSLDGVPIGAGHTCTRTDDGTWVIDPPVNTSEAVSLNIRELTYFEHGIGGKVVSIRFRNGGVIDALGRLCSRLSVKYHWDLTQAVAFVLTDTLPIVPIITFSVAPRQSNTVLTRITLEIDPALSPQEVREAYSRVRSEVVGERRRSMKPKNQTLAVWFAGRPAGQPWLDTMRGWNEAVMDDWRYALVSNFARDCRRAIKNLIDPSYKINDRMRGQL